MKTKIVLFTFIVIFSFVACKKDTILENTPEVLSETVKKGNWEISYFWDSDKDETTNFSNYEFTFEDSGVLSATNGTYNYSGTWSTRTDDSELKMDISFSSPTDFVELSDDWHIIEFTDTELKLEDVSGGDGSVDYLTFIKM